MCVCACACVCVSYVDVHVLRYLKEELAWPKDKLLQVISNYFTTKELENKAISGLNNIICIAVWSLITYSNCSIIKLILMHYVSTIEE